MPRRFASARGSVPVFRSAGGVRAAPCRTVPVPAARRETRDPALMIRAAIASHLRRHPDLARETYAHCERAPLGWESRTQHNEQEG